MADMNFFFSLKEREDFVKFCFNNGFTLIPGIHYKEDSYLLVNNLIDYHKYMNECMAFFIVHDDYSIYPLELDSFKKNGKKKYFIMQRYGGPAIYFYTPVFAEINNNQIASGLISSYPFYYHNIDKFVPNEKFKTMYHLLTSYIRKKSKKIKIGTQLYWVGINSMERVRDGTVEFIEMHDFDWATIL